MNKTTDFLIVGSGIAGLCYALKVADHGKVAIITKREIGTTATSMAQGGIAAVASAQDSFEEHVRDTMEAGSWLPHEDVVKTVIEHGPEAIRNLIDWGVRFSRDDSGEYDLHREGGHSQRRIYHAKDETGKEIERALVEAVRQHPNITVYENHIAVDLITESKAARRRVKPDRCLGIYVLDTTTGQVETFGARFTVLAPPPAAHAVVVDRAGVIIARRDGDRKSVV